MQQLRSSVLSGSILWVRYSFAPNRFHYCGPDSNLTLFEYAVNKTSDGGLEQILSHFEAAFPYMDFIASENQINNPFDWRVVEAYWLGNNLLANVNIEKFYRHLKERFKKRTDAKVFESIVGKLPAGAKPNHAFHVLEIFRQLGSSRGINFGPVINTINNCLISWGEIVAIDQDTLKIKHQPLVLDKKLFWGPPEIKQIEYKFLGKTFLENPQIGDWISFHWNWACEILTERQLKNLQRWTLWQLKIANISFNVPNR